MFCNWIAGSLMWQTSYDNVRGQSNLCVCSFTSQQPYNDCLTTWVALTCVNVLSDGVNYCPPDVLEASPRQADYRGQTGDETNRKANAKTNRSQHFQAPLCCLNITDKHQCCYSHSFRTMLINYLFCSCQMCAPSLFREAPSPTNNNPMLG